MFEGLIIGLHIPGESFLHKLDPRIKIVTLVLLIAVIFIKITYPIVIFSFVFLIINILVTRIPILYFIKGQKPIIIFAFITFLLNSLLIPGTILIQYGKLSVSIEGLYLGGLMALRLVIIVSYSALITYTTSPVQFSDGLSSLFKPASRIGFPVQQLSIIISIALRFIPILALEADKIIKAQTSRGAKFDHGNIIKRIYSIIPILIPLLINAIKKADELAIAMEARCFNSYKRSKMKKLTLTKYDFFAGIIISLYLIIFFLLR